MTSNTNAARIAWQHRTGWKVGTMSPALPRGFKRLSPRDRWNWQTLDSGEPVRAFDHVYRITCPERGVALLTMPYGLSDDDAHDVTRWCEERNGHWRMIGDGWHFPGTVAIVIAPTPPKGERPSRQIARMRGQL